MAYACAKILAAVYLFTFTRQANMNRVVRGIFGGALLGGLVLAAITLIVILVSAPFFKFDVQQRDAEPGMLIIFCMVLATHGLIMGGLAGIASQLPKSGVSFFRCFLFISGIRNAANSHRLTACDWLSKQSRRQRQ